MAGDAVRYSIGWFGWGVVVVAGVLASLIALALTKPWKTLLRVPLPLALLLALMSLSVVWSQYRNATWLGLGVQLGATVFALFLANQFGWRQLLNIFANTVRFILGSSLLFELWAAIFGPIKPFFPNYEGDEPPASAYYWSQGQLFDGDRIQGIVGNANLIAFTAVLGMLLFLVEFIVTHRNRTIPLVSLVLAVLMAALAKSAGMTLAIFLVGFAALIAILAEGRERATRHAIYRYGLWALASVAVIGLIYRTELFEMLGRSSDASGRFYIWGEVLSLIWEKPLEGWGWIGYWIPGVEPFEGLIVINGVPMYQAHNTYLDTWLQLGLIGLALLLWLLIQGFVRLWAVAVRHTNPLYLFPLFAFLVIAAQSLTESRMLIEIGWVLLVLLTTKSREPFAELEPLGRTPKRLKLLRAPLRWLRGQ
jgi:exopolysaccharide production protein ExoQ